MVCYHPSSLLLSADELWAAVKMEIATFLMTALFALFVRSLFRKPSSQPNGAWSPARKHTMQSHVHRRPDRATACRSGSGEGAKKCPGETANIDWKQDAAQTVDEIVRATRGSLTAGAAARVLDLYAGLQRELQQRGSCVAGVARDAQVLELYTAAVQCAVRVGRCGLVEDIMDDMAKQGIARPLAFYESAMKQLAGQRQHRLALSVYDRLAADGLEPSVVTCSCLVSFAAEVGEYGRAAMFFGKLTSQTTPGIRAYMTMLRVHGKCGDWPATMLTLRDMQRRGVKVDTLVLNIVFATGVAAGRIHEVEELLFEVDSQETPIADVVSYNTLIKGHAQRDDPRSAVAVLRRMRERGHAPNSISFNSAMDAAVRGQQSADAWCLLADMRAAGLRPDKYTASILIKDLDKSPTPAQVRDALKLLVEVAEDCDGSLRCTLFRAVMSAALQLAETEAESPLQMHVYAQMRRHGVQATAAMHRRLRELSARREGGADPAL